MTTTTQKNPLATITPEQRRQVVQYIRPDVATFRHTMAECTAVADQIDNVANEQEKGKSLTREWVHDVSFDVFNSMFKARPKALEDNGDPLSRDLVHRMMRDENYKRLHMYTSNDDVVSALETAAVLGDFVKSIPDDLKKKARQAQRAEQEAQETAAMVQALLETDETVDPEEIDEARERAKHAKQQAQQSQQQLTAAVQNNGQRIAQAVHKAVTAAADNAESVQAACRTFGTNSQAVSGGMTPEQKLALAKTVQQAGPAFRKLMQMLGRVMADAQRKQASKMRHESGEIVDIVLGSNPFRLLAGERVLHVDPDLELLGLARLAMNSAMQYDVEAREPQSKGDIVVLFDESGSMSGQKEMEAKAVTLALAHVAIRQKRTLVVHFFQSQVTHTVRISKDDDTPGADGMAVALRKMADIARRGTGGGTLFDPPLNTACDTIDKSLPKADVLMLTDGESCVAQATIDRINTLRRTKGLHVYSMLFGATSGGACAATVKQFSDRVWLGESLLGGPADDLFELV